MMRFVDVLYGLPFMFLVILFLSLVNGLHSTSAQHRDAVQQVHDLEAAGNDEEAQIFATENKVTTEVRTAVFLAEHFNPLYAIVLALGLVSWLTMARITRGQVLTLREREFVVAARTVGAGNLRIIFLHIVPNLLGPVIIYTTLTIPTIILAEAFLSFLGLGISEPDCSWGSLARDGIVGINVIKPYWWLLTYPAGAISLALFSLNFIGDGLRDALDPKMKR
jgi:ABC-type dipeptide/oligopeptide/nickel transport system permease subunit